MLCDGSLLCGLDRHSKIQGPREIFYSEKNWEDLNALNGSKNKVAIMSWIEKVKKTTRVTKALC